jgi:predicted outer membrane repeat protein
MDSSRFDRLVRSLARPASRRGTLATLLGGAVAGALARTTTASHAKDAAAAKPDAHATGDAAGNGNAHAARGRCPSGKKPCHGRCIKRHKQCQKPGQACRDNGQPCNKPNQCCTRQCAKGVCAPKLGCTENGNACQQNSDCCTGNCFAQACAAKPTTCSGQSSSAGATGCCANAGCCQPPANQCNASGLCCAPNCGGRQCGDDGCGNGGTCGACPSGQTCNAQTGTCQGQPPCTVCASGCPFTSIQKAIDAAAAGDTITVCPGRYTENLTIGKNLVLAGSDAENLPAVAGSGGSSVVTVQNGVTAAIQSMAFGLGVGSLVLGSRLGGGLLNFGDLTLTAVSLGKNTSDQGGAIYSFGPLTLDNCSVIDNRANDRGGGIYAQGQGDLTLTNGASISGNSAANQGGGIYNEGVAAVRGAPVVDGNTAGSDGGGIFNPGTVTAQNSTVIDKNTARNGGGAYNAGVPGEPPQDRPALTVADSAVTNNMASAVGGGIFNDAGVVTMQAGTVINNKATVTGGGLFNTDGGAVTFDAESAVVENTPDDCVGTTTRLAAGSARHRAG